MKPLALSGLIIGAIVALGRLSTAQWHTAGQALLALTLAHGLTVLPWVLAILFARLWWRERWRARLYEQLTADGFADANRLQREVWKLERVAASKRKRRTS